MSLLIVINKLMSFIMLIVVLIYLWISGFARAFRCEVFPWTDSYGNEIDCYLCGWAPRHRSTTGRHNQRSYYSTQFESICFTRFEQRQGKKVVRPLSFILYQNLIFLCNFLFNSILVLVVVMVVVVVVMMVVVVVMMMMVVVVVMMMMVVVVMMNWWW